MRRQGTPRTCNSGHLNISLFFWPPQSFPNHPKQPLPSPLSSPKQRPRTCNFQKSKPKSILEPCTQMNTIGYVIRFSLKKNYRRHHWSDSLYGVQNHRRWKGGLIDAFFCKTPNSVAFLLLLLHWRFEEHKWVSRVGFQV